MRRTTVACLLAGAIVVLTAGPALAHASLDVAAAPAGSTTDVVLRVPVERDAGNQLVELQAPDGYAIPSCEEDAGWSCEVEEDGGSTVVSFDRDGGDASLEEFAFELTAADEPRNDDLPTVQTYDDGVEVAWIGDGGDRPAPVFETTAADDEVEENTEEVDDAPVEPTQEASSPASQPSSADEPPDAEPTSAAPSPTESPSESGSSPITPGDADSGLEQLAIGGLVVLAVVAVVVYVVRTRS